ncbi:MAG: hypothetical protein QXM08_05360 [Thermofilaceae archaeon]
MEPVVTYGLLLLVTLAFVATAAYFLFSAANSPPPLPPVTVSLPPGAVVYRINHTYFIPLKFTVAREPMPVRVCSLTITYVDPQGSMVTETVDLSSARDGEPVNFRDGTVVLQSLLINRTHEQTMRITFTPRTSVTIGTGQSSPRPLTIVFNFCLEGRPDVRWSDSLRMPDTVLTP